MKQRLSLLIGFLLAAATASAQPEVGSLFLTPHVGFNASTLLGDADVRVQYVWDDGMGAAVTSRTLPKLGFNGGLGLEYQLRKKWAISVGVDVNELGVRFKDFTLEDHTISNAYIRLCYINVPVLWKYYVNDWLALGVGLQPGYMLSKNAYADFSRGGGYTVSSSADDFQHFDLSLPLSASVFSAERMFYELRCNLGISNLIQGYWIPFPLSCYNESLTFAIGYRFQL